MLCFRKPNYYQSYISSQSLLLKKFSNIYFLYFKNLQREFHLNGHLRSHRRIDNSEFVSGQDLQRIVPEIEDGNESGVTNSFQALQG